MWLLKLGVYKFFDSQIWIVLDLLTGMKQSIKRENNLRQSINFKRNVYSIFNSNQMTFTNWGSYTFSNLSSGLFNSLWNNLVLRGKCNFLETIILKWDIHLCKYVLKQYPVFKQFLNKFTYNFLLTFIPLYSDYSVLALYKS